MMMQYVYDLNELFFFTHLLIIETYSSIFIISYEIIVRGVGSSPSLLSSFFSLYKIKLLEPSSKSSSKIFSTKNS
jgi:hypothetical protein